MKLKLLASAVAMSAVVFLPVQSMAEGRICPSSINWVGVSPDGNMLVSFSSMGVATLCNMNGTINTTRGLVSSETCKGWYAGFTTAYARSATVELWFDFGASSAPQCNALGFDFSVPSNYPYFVTFHS